MNDGTPCLASAILGTFLTSINVETQVVTYCADLEWEEKDTNSFLKEQVPTSAAAYSGIQFIWKKSSPREILHIDARYSAGTWSRIESFTPPLMLSVAVARGNSSVWLVPLGAGYR